MADRGEGVSDTVERRELVKAGAVFDPALRTLGDWKALTIPT
jgi:hypothetical protein